MAHRPVVLLVDDDPGMRELLAQMFSLDGGFRIGGVAADGFEGAMLAADIDPDVVILDFFMPRWDGARAAEFIKSRCPNTKIIAFSAVLTEHPEWADYFMVKDQIAGILELVRGLTRNGAAAHT
jgi:DNA-binding NarL/FixJ family response regulator